MKGNESKVLLGMLVVAVLIVLAAYKFIYSEDVAKAEVVQGEINNLQARLTELNEKNANRPLYEAGITDSNDIINTILALYGPGNTPEKTIMTVVDLCNKTGCTISSIAFQENRLVYESDQKDETGKSEIQIFKGGMSLTIRSGYTQLKKFTDYINSYPERMNVEVFNASFDAATGLLSITATVNMYHVVDKNHEYVAPVVEDIELGTTNIFKTNELFTEEELEGEEPADNNVATSVDTENTTTTE